MLKFKLNITRQNILNFTKTFLNSFFHLLINMEEENKPETKEEVKEVKEKENKTETKEEVKEVKEKEIKPKKNISKEKETLTDKMRENPWIISTFVFGVLILALLVSNFSGNMTGKVISEEQAGEAILNFVQSRTQGQGELIKLNDFDNNFYEAVVSFQGQEIPLYATKNGEYLVSGLTPLMILDEEISVSQQTPPTSSEYSEEDLVKLSEFSSCLAEKGLIIYGANWCGWTKKLAIDTLGGFDIVGESYVECTENEELCASEGIKGYPTIKFNGEPYQGERTLEALGGATDCTVPTLSIQQQVSNEDASCS